MEIGPITGVRAVSLLSMHRTENTQSPVFEIEACARTGDESSSLNRHTPDRELEDEDSEFCDDIEPELEAHRRRGTPDRINFFA